jgi:S1-C subfamily serine protease
MKKPSGLKSELWQGRLHRLRAGLSRAGLFAAGIAAALIAILVYRLLEPGPHLLTTQDVSTRISQVMASATPPAAFSVGVYQAILPSLVLVQTKGPGSDGSVEDTLGSGVIIDDSGDILTCLHVVAGSTDVLVTFADGSQSNATVTTQQPENDIAVLRPDQPPAQIVPATLGNPNGMQVGDEAYVVGAPFGLYDSLTAGVISGFNRTFKNPNNNQEIKGLIQIDAAVNPGNSGGPLLNRYGQVIGIVEGIVNPVNQDFFVGIGFAVPISTAGGALGLPPD